jgi:hypothetical protein
LIALTAIELQARIPPFSRQSNPRKFLASYDTAVISTCEDTKALAKSFIMAVKDIAHDWYISLKPLLIQSWDQIKTLATFQGYQPETKTTPDVMNYVPHKLIISTSMRNGDILPILDEWTHHAPPHIE